VQRHVAALHVSGPGTRKRVVATFMGAFSSVHWPRQPTGQIPVVTNLYRHLSACSSCHLKPHCTTEKLRRIRRWEQEDLLDDIELRLDQKPDAMRIRRSTVEHPFGTLKAWMGYTHFLTRTREKAAAEMSLHVLAYNFKRVLNIIGIVPLMAALKA